MVLYWGVCVGSLPSALIPLIIKYQWLGSIICLVEYIFFLLTSYCLRYLVCLNVVKSSQGEKYTFICLFKFFGHLFILWWKRDYLNISQVWSFWQWSLKRNMMYNWEQAEGKKKLISSVLISSPPVQIKQMLDKLLKYRSTTELGETSSFRRMKNYKRKILTL